MSDEPIERFVPPGDFQRIALDQIQRLLASAKLSKEIERGEGFVRRDAAQLIRHLTHEEVVQAIVVAWAAARDFPELRRLYARSTALAAEALAAPDPESLLSIYRELMRLHGVAADDGAADGFQLAAKNEAVTLTAAGAGNDPEGVPIEHLENDGRDQTFLAAVANMLAGVRRAGRTLTQDERAAVAAAYRLLDRGVRLPSAFVGLGVYGFRRYQTSLSLANPGEGHISVTCAHKGLLNGTIVHIEHIDRDGVDNREVIEPYRLPAALNAARVRLHTGLAAPCTAYIGRPVFENGVALRHGTDIYRPIVFEQDLLKSVHTTASACTAMFMNGVADCKIAIERMSYAEAVHFMRAVAGNVVRDPTRQYLSAAFNINLPLWDDRAGTGRLVDDPFEIARVGIELAVAGRFDKVTWDGASNEVPSRPIIEQIPLPQWIALVHEAHERGLETYVSAGMNASHMSACVNIGVDGVGIGTSLHFRHPVTKAIGQLKADAIREVLARRDAAAALPLGRAAQMLARLDRMFFEGSLPKRLEPVRQALFASLRDGKAEEAEALLAQIILSVSDEPEGHPLFAQARRLIETYDEDPVGRERLGDDQWKARIELADRFLKARDLSGLKEMLS